MEYATQLVVDICGGEVGEITEVVGTLPTRKAVEFRVARLNSVLGIHFEDATVSKFLDQLQFEYTLNAGVFTVTAPSYRFDIEREEDLVEEIARLHGYDQVPAIAPVAALTILPMSESKQHQYTIKNQLVALGYQEIVNYSFVDESWETGLIGNPNPIKLKNPIASQYSVMRTSLWGGLIDTLVYNLNRQQERAYLFEFGSVYTQKDEQFTEVSKVSGLIYGSEMPEQWGEPAKEVDFFDMKAHVEVLLGEDVKFEKATHNALHPGQTAKIIKRGKQVGWLGKLHPKWQQHYSLVKSTFMFELDYDAIVAVSKPRYVEVSKLLPVRRDIAVVVDESVEMQAITVAVKKAKIPLISAVNLFDLYQGKGIDENQKSLALSVLMHDTQKTLIDEEADRAIANLLALLEDKFSAVLRS
jgi:phenylalanyl-tRNA synthetase beta chain